MTAVVVVSVSAVSLDERVTDRSQVGSHTRRAGHLDPFDQPGELAGECVFVVAADHDLDAAVGPATSDLESTAEPHSEHAYPLGRAGRDVRGDG
ncbi:hypothetical protein ABT008_22530 [Micromonospora sp. NPDC002389]|uniref:hypothetical protein n=1 Tax=Micromonospora sp. NPDC002389 TaxID=3154272 RepID=UPI0033183558